MSVIGKASTTGRPIQVEQSSVTAFSANRVETDEPERNTGCQRYNWRLRGLALVTTLHVCATKVFLGGVGWQGVSLAIDVENNTTLCVS